MLLNEVTINEQGEPTICLMTINRNSLKPAGGFGFLFYRFHQVTSSRDKRKWNYSVLLW